MRLELGDGAWFELHDNFVQDLGALSHLISALEWQQRSIRLYGRNVLEPRKTIWMGDPGTNYRYSGRDNVPQPWIEPVVSIRKQLAKIAKTSFNSCLLNWYRDGSDSIGMHSDDEHELGKHPIIASVSLGATRKFQIKRKAGSGVAKLELDLYDGSLLIMGGNMQQHYKHGVPKQPRVKSPRINLTFREIKIVPV